MCDYCTQLASDETLCHACALETYPVSSFLHIDAAAAAALHLLPQQQQQQRLQPRILPCSSKYGEAHAAAKNKISKKKNCKPLNRRNPKPSSPQGWMPLISLEFRVYSLGTRIKDFFSYFRQVLLLLRRQQQQEGQHRELNLCSVYSLGIAALPWGCVVCI